MLNVLRNVSIWQRVEVGGTEFLDVDTRNSYHRVSVLKIEKTSFASNNSTAAGYSSRHSLMAIPRALSGKKIYSDSAWELDRDDCERARQIGVL